MSTPITFAPAVGPSRSTAVTHTPQVLLAAYGDGYEQRVIDGIQNRRLEATVIWAVMTHTDADAVDLFFANREGVEPFLYALPPDATVRRWVCPAWTRNELDDMASSITATWREVFDI